MVCICVLQALPTLQVVGAIQSPHSLRHKSDTGGRHKGVELYIAHALSEFGVQRGVKLVAG